MLPFDIRKGEVLSAIIQQFIQTAEPVGSKTILVHYHMSVSPATIRNDMAFLENEGLIAQPHTSAGRVPTAKGYRLYIEELADYAKAETLAKKHLAHLLEEVERNKTQQKIHNAVSLLAQAIPNVAFASIPENKRTFYLGISNMLRQPEFVQSPLQASQVIEILEESVHFLEILDQLDIDETPRIFIGKENLLPQIESCSLIVTRYRWEENEGYLGILGPTRMPYAFNLAMLKEIHQMLKENQF